EQTSAEEGDCCAVPPNGNGKRGGRLAWGGPSRIDAKPIFGWSDTLPHESSGKVILAQVELGTDCKIRRVHVGVRRYVGAASAAKVYQYALDGERDINKDNRGRFYFHIRGRQPSAVTLYLRAAKFSTLYYTELGQHKHTVGVTLQDLTIPA